jgi:hypothetical protein
LIQEEISEESNELNESGASVAPQCMRRKIEQLVRPDLGCAQRLMHGPETPVRVIRRRCGRIAIERVYRPIDAQFSIFEVRAHESLTPKASISERAG